jgi:hypothetical protein
MSRIGNRRNVLAAIVVLLLLICLIWYESAPWRGRWAANRDLANGRFLILGYGLPPRGVIEYRQILAERYGVEYQQVAACIVSPTLVSYADAYDRVSEQAIQQKFGQDIFKRSWAEANRRFQENHKAELQNVSHSE